MWVEADGVTIHGNFLMVHANEENMGSTDWAKVFDTLTRCAEYGTHVEQAIACSTQ